MPRKRPAPVVSDTVTVSREDLAAMVAEAAAKLHVGQPIRPPQSAEEAQAQLDAGIRTFGGGKPPDPRMPIPSQFSDQETMLRQRPADEVRIEMGDDPLVKSLQAARRGEHALASDALSLAVKAAEERIDERAGPNMHKRFRLGILNPATLATQGSRGYVMLQNKDGSPIKFNDMVIGAIPEETMTARDQASVDQHNALVGSKLTEDENGRLVNRDNSIPMSHQEQIAKFGPAKPAIGFDDDDDD